MAMKFEPKSYYTGETISLIMSLLVMIGLIGAMYLYFSKAGGFTSPSTLNLAAPTTETKQVKKTVSKRKKK